MNSTEKTSALGVCIVALSIMLGYGWRMASNDICHKSEYAELVTISGNLSEIADKMPKPPEPPENLVKKEELVNVCFTLLYGKADPDLSEDTFIQSRNPNVVKALEYCHKYFPHLYGN